MRIKISIHFPEKSGYNSPREISFDTDYKSEDDLPLILREVAEILESPVIQDTELF
jgi:hypothetical protein